MAGEVGLSKIMKVIKNLQVMPAIKVMLHEIVNNAQYVGKVAHDYQVRCKSVKSDKSDILMSDKCLYSAHTFEQGYVPKHNTPVSMQEANYEWILWNSPADKKNIALGKYDTTIGRKGASQDRALQW